MTRFVLTCGLGLIGGAILGCAGAPAEPPRQEALAVAVGQIHASLSSGDLLRHSAKRAVAVSGSPVYPGRTVEVDAVPMDALLTPSEVPEAMHLLFECKDGFAASIPASKVLPRKAGSSRAYLAVEDPANPLPAVPHAQGRAGSTPRDPEALSPRSAQRARVAGTEDAFVRRERPAGR